MSKLEWRDGDDGKRHYLDGVGVHCGTGLEVRMKDGTWKRVSYELTWPTKEGHRSPLLCFVVPLAGAPEEDRAVAQIVCPSWAELRWPQR